MYLYYRFQTKIIIKIRSEIYNNRDKIIVIAGKWGLSDEYNKFTSKVYGKKQVAIIKNKINYRGVSKYPS